MGKNIKIHKKINALKFFEVLEPFLDHPMWGNTDGQVFVVALGFIFEIYFSLNTKLTSNFFRRFVLMKILNYFSTMMIDDWRNISMVKSIFAALKNSIASHYLVKWGEKCPTRSQVKWGHKKKAVNSVDLVSQKCCLLECGNSFWK